MPEMRQGDQVTFAKASGVTSTFAKAMVDTSGSSSVGRARPCQGRGREFESRFPLRKLMI